MNVESLTNTFIQVLYWTVVKTEKEKKELITTYHISEDYFVFARNILGDVVTINNGNIVVINHETPTPDEDIKLCKSNKRFWEFLIKLQELPPFSEDTELNELKAIKKEVKALRKLAPKGLKDDISDGLDEIKELIDDLKFSASQSGKMLNASLDLRADFYKALGHPKKYKAITLEKDFSNPGDETMYVFGWLTAEDESIEGINAAIKTLNSGTAIKIKMLKTYEEYQARL